MYIYKLMLLLLWKLSIINNLKNNSLKWIHKIREEHYKKTKDKNLKDIIKDSVKKAKTS